MKVDTDIDGARVRREREARAWTQEHLAGATGLSLRTIQRIETSGTASFESLNALAAALSLTLAQLRGTEAVRHEAARHAPLRLLTMWSFPRLFAAIAVAAVLTPPFLALQVPSAVALWLSGELALYARRRMRADGA